MIRFKKGKDSSLWNSNKRCHLKSKISKRFQMMQNKFQNHSWHNKDYQMNKELKMRNLE